MVVVINELDSILGGYSLHILQPQRRGVFWVSSDLNSGKKVKSFSLGKLRSGKESYSFSFSEGGGGVLGKLRFELRKESYSFFILGGGGGVLGKVRLGLWEQFQFGGCSGTKF